MITLLVIFILTISSLYAASNNQSNAICYSGSSLYQKVTQSCNEKDSSYTGEWYCSTIKICESFINKDRQCIETRGCATEQECISSSSTTGYYNGETIQITNGINPGGMTITARCCSAHDFPTDDVVAIDYAEICNNANRQNFISLKLQFGITAVILLLSMYHISF